MYLQLLQEIIGVFDRQGFHSVAGTMMDTVRRNFDEQAAQNVFIGIEGKFRAAYEARRQAEIEKEAKAPEIQGAEGRMQLPPEGSGRPV